MALKIRRSGIIHVAPKDLMGHLKWTRKAEEWRDAQKEVEERLRT